MPITRSPLHAILAAENDALRTFVDVLRSEQQLLLKGDVDQLGLFAEPKARLTLALTQLGEQRLQWLRSAGAAPDRHGMEHLLHTQYPGDSAEAAQWAQLLSLAASAHQMNTRNGLLIHARMKYTQRALSTLFGAARLPAAYTADGSTIGFRAAHQLAVA